MSLIEKAIRSAERPKSFWMAFALCFLLPVIGFPYVLLVHYRLIDHTLPAFLFFLVVMLVAASFAAYYFFGIVTGKYRHLKGRQWSELPW